MTNRDTPHSATTRATSPRSHAGYRSTGSRTLRQRWLLLGASLSVAILATASLADSIVLENSVINSSGRQISGGNFRSLTSLGEAIARPLEATGGNFVLHPGFIAKKKLGSPDPADVDTQPAELFNVLNSSFPNPFQSSTTVRFRLASSADTSVEVFDAAGRRIRVLYKGDIDAGAHELIWDGRSDRGDRVASGVYFARLVSGSFSDHTKIVLQR